VAPASEAAACDADYVVTVPLIHPYMQSLQAAFEKEAKAHNATYSWLSPTEFDEPKQLQLTETALGSDCLKGLGILTATPDLFKTVIATAEAKVPVLELVCHPQQYAKVCIEIDNEKGLSTVAKLVAEKLDGKGNVVISTDPGLPNQIKRDILINYWKANNPDIKVVGVMPDCDTVDKTVGCAENALSQYPEMNAYVGTGFNNAVGAASVFPKANRTDIVVTGLDNDPAVIDGIKKGTVTFTLQQNPGGQGRLFFLVPYWQGVEGLKPVGAPVWIDTPGFIVDKSNVDNYEAAQAADTDTFLEQVKAKYFTK
jgi:ribose transport system substrate-binding protein